MAQHDFNIANATFPATRTDINNALSAINSTQSGTSTPSGAVAGTIWLDTTSATTPTLKYYDGTDNISLATIDHVSNTVNWLDSTVSITGLSTTATATVLTLSDSSQTSSVNLILQNQKEIRFSETTANGSNYVGFKAPASLTADKIWILPSADATVSGQALTSDASGTLSWTTISSGTSWQSVKTSGFTAVSGEGYPCNTTSSSFTVTLPASPSVGSYVQIVDYAGTFATNNIILGANSNKINGVVENKALATNREAVTITYVDSTQGWVASSGANEGTQSLDPAPYSVDFLVIAGGGGGAGNGDAFSGGGGAGGYRNSYSTETSGGGGSSESSLDFKGGVVYTITVGGGGAGGANNFNGNGVTGSDSLISGTGITTITSNGGGGGGSYNDAGLNGGSGGGAGEDNTTAGTGTANQGFNGGNTDGSSGSGAGGGGASSVGTSVTDNTGGNGGNGLASSITGSSVTRAGGGGGGGYTTIGTGGSGGGGNGGLYVNSPAPTAGTVNTGSGGGGASGTGTGASGGKGVVILRIATANYSGTTTGSPTVTTDGSDKVIVFNDSGSITG